MSRFNSFGSVWIVYALSGAMLAVNGVCAERGSELNIAAVDAMPTFEPGPPLGAAARWRGFPETDLARPEPQRMRPLQSGFAERFGVWAVRDPNRPYERPHHYFGLRSNWLEVTTRSFGLSTGRCFWPVIRGSTGFSSGQFRSEIIVQARCELN